MHVTKDLLAGLLFAVLGGAALLISTGYRLGSALDMGPGYFPVVVSTVITVLGLIAVARALLWSDPSRSLGHVAVRPLLFILAAVVAFALMLEPLGLVPSVAALVVIGRLAKPEGSWREIGVLAAVLAVIAVAIFVYGLNMPLELWPSA